MSRKDHAVLPGCHEQARPFQKRRFVSYQPCLLPFSATRMLVVVRVRKARYVALLAESLGYAPPRLEAVRHWLRFPWHTARYHRMPASSCLLSSEGDYRHNSEASAVK